MYTETDDLNMMQTPNRWPQWPVLPLKKRKRERKDEDFGFLREAGLSGTVPPVVHIGNIFGGEVTGKVEYDSLDDVAREWEVD